MLLKLQSSSFLHFGTPALNSGTFQMNANERVTMDVFQWLLGDITIDKNPEAEPMGKIIIMDKNPKTEQMGGAELRRTSS